MYHHVWCIMYRDSYVRQAGSWTQSSPPDCSVEGLSRTQDGWSNGRVMTSSTSLHHSLIPVWLRFGTKQSQGQIRGPFNALLAGLSTWLARTAHCPMESLENLWSPEAFSSKAFSLKEASWPRHHAHTTLLPHGHRSPDQRELPSLPRFSPHFLYSLCGQALIEIAYLVVNPQLAMCYKMKTCT